MMTWAVPSTRSFEATTLEDAYGERPLWRGRLHQIAFWVSLPAGVVLVSAARTLGAQVALGIYWLTLAGQFAASTVYHRFARSPHTVKWMRRVDHSMIFCLFAGTYTPLCLLVLPPSWGLPMLAVSWLIAISGSLSKMLRLHEKGQKSGSWLYTVLCVGSVATLPVVLDRLGSTRAVLWVLGGLLYATGTMVLGKRRPNPLPEIFGYHEVWHLFTVAGSACHFVLMMMVL